MDRMLLKIGFNTGIQLAGKVVSVILSMVTVFLLTRYLGASGYGNFMLAFTYVSFFSALADFVLHSSMVRELSQHEHDAMRMGSFLWTKVGLVLVSSLGAAFLLLFFPYSISVKLGILIAILAVAVSGITNYGMIIFQSRIRLDLVTLID